MNTPILKRLLGLPLFTVLAVTAVIFSTTATSSAAAKTWAPGTTDFNLGSNWTGGLPGTADNATFTGAAGTQPQVTLNISVLNINFSTAASTGYTLSNTGGAVLTLLGTGTGASSAINSSATSGTNTVSTALSLGAIGTQTFTSATNGILLVSGDIGGTGALSIGGGGIVRLSGNNSYSGGTTWGTGNLVNVNSATALGTGTVTITGGQFDNTSGGALTLTNNNAQTWNGNLQFNGTNALNMGAGAVSLGAIAGTSRTLNIGGAGAFTVGGVISDGTTANSLIKTGSGSLILNGNNAFTGSLTVSTGTLTLGGTNAYSGATIVSAGSLTLGGPNGSILNTSGISLASGTSLTLDNTGAGNNSANRLANSQALTLSGSSLIYKGSDQAATSSSETMGALSTGAGTNVVTVTFGGTNAADLTSASFSHTAGQNTALINGLNLGANSGSTSVGRLFLTSAPTLVGTTAALSTGINSAAKDTVVVPYLLGETTATTGGTGTATGTANTFLTYNASTGLRPLNLTDEFTNNAITAGTNTRITSNTSAASTAAINSLVISGGTLTINSGVTLTDTSGAILFSGTSAIGGATGTLGFGSAEAMITTNSGVTGTISSGISTTSGIFTKGGTGTLSATGSLTSTTGLTFYNNNTGAMTFGAAAASVTASGSIINAGVGTGSTTIAGIIGSGITGISQNSATSLLNLSGTSNTFTGPINVAAGATLQYANNGSMGDVSNSISLGAGATLNGSAGAFLGSSRSIALTSGAILAGSQAIAGNISGTGPLTSNGTILLSGNNSFSGGIAQTNTVSRTILTSDMNIGGSASALSFQNSGNTVTILGNEFTSFGSHTVTFGAGNSNNLTFDIQDPGNNFNFNRTNNVTVNSGSTGGVLTKTGLGTMTITVNQTFTNSSGAALTMSGGKVVLDRPSGGQIANAAQLAFGGGTLELLGNTGSSVTQTTGNIFRVDAGGGTIIVNNNGGSNTTTLALGNIATTFNAGSSLNLRTINPGSGSSVITTTSLNANGIIGSGRVTYNGTSFATNTTNLSGGAIGAYTGATTGSVGNTTVATTTNYENAGNASIGVATYANTLKLTTTTTGQSFDLGGQIYTVTTGGLLFAGTDDYAINNGTLKSATATNSDLIIHQYGAGTLTVGAVIANGVGTSILTKTGSGKLVLTNANTYTGATYISGGVLSVSANNQLGATAGSALNLNGGTLQVTTGFSTAHAVALGGSGGTFDIADGQTLTSTGVVSGAGLVLANTGATGSGILALNQNNSFTGGVYINSGVLQMGNAGAINTSGFNTLSFGSGTTTTLQMNNFSTIVAGISSSSTSAIIENGAAGAGTSTLTGNIGGTNTFAGTMRNNGGSGSGVLAFTKEGAGTLTLSGANTYTGTTIVNGGTLLISGGQSAATGAVSVNAGATLGGIGTIGGVTTVANNGILTPGESATGKLTFSNGLAFSGTDSKLTMEIIGTGRGVVGGYDAIDLGVAASLTYNGDLTLNINAAIANGTYDLFAFTLAPTNSFDTIQFSGGGPYTGSFSNSSGIWSATSGGQTFTFTQSTGDLSVVPEPSTWALLAGGLTVVVTLRRRRR